LKEYGPSTGTERVFWMSDDLIVKVSKSFEVYCTKDAVKIATLSKERFEYLLNNDQDEIIGFLCKKSNRIYSPTI
jgi:hypothetical protein